MELGQSEGQSAPMKSDIEVCFQSLAVTALPQILTRLTLSYPYSSIPVTQTPAPERPLAISPGTQNSF